MERRKPAGARNKVNIIPIPVDKTSILPFQCRGGLTFRFECLPGALGAI